MFPRKSFPLNEGGGRLSPRRTYTLRKRFSGLTVETSIRESVVGSFLGGPNQGPVGPDLDPCPGKVRQSFSLVCEP